MDERVDEFLEELWKDNVVLISKYAGKLPSDAVGFEMIKNSVAFLMGTLHHQQEARRIIEEAVKAGEKWYEELYKTEEE